MLLGHVERAEVGTWIGRCYRDVGRHPELDIELNDVIVDCQGTHVARNWAVDNARLAGADVLFMVDHDNAPHPNWFLFACEFLRKKPAAVLASPYCGKRPFQPNDPDRQVLVTVEEPTNPYGSRYVTRDEAADLTGVKPAFGVPTGAIALGMKLFDTLPTPWFEYRYLNAEKSKAGTEDFMFSEHVVKNGGEVFCDWDHWADHFKIERIGKPQRGERMSTADGQSSSGEWTGETFEHDCDVVNFHLEAVKVAVEKREPQGWRVATMCVVPLPSNPTLNEKGVLVQQPPQMAFSIIYVRQRSAVDTVCRLMEKRVETNGHAPRLEVAGKESSG